MSGRERSRGGREATLEPPSQAFEGGSSSAFSSCNLQGCQKVAGGRSAAQTSGRKLIVTRALKGCSDQPIKSRTLSVCPRLFQHVPVVCDHRLLSNPSGCRRE